MKLNLNYKSTVNHGDYPSTQDTFKKVQTDEFKQSKARLKQTGMAETFGHTVSKIGSTLLNAGYNLYDELDGGNPALNKEMKKLDKEDNNIVSDLIKRGGLYFNTPLDQSHATSNGITQIARNNFVYQKQWLDELHKDQSNTSGTSDINALATGLAETAPYLLVDYPMNSAKLISSALQVGTKQAIKTIAKEIVKNSGKNLVSDVGVAYTIGEDTNKLGQATDVLSALLMSTVGTPLTAIPPSLTRKFGKDALTAYGDAYPSKYGKNAGSKVQEEIKQRAQRHVDTGKWEDGPITSKIKADIAAKRRARTIDPILGAMHDTAAGLAETINKKVGLDSRIVDGEIRYPRYSDLQKDAKAKPSVSKYTNVTADGNSVANKPMSTVNNRDKAGRVYGEARTSHMGQDSDMAMTYKQDPALYYNDFKKFTKETEASFDNLIANIAKYGDEQTNLKGGTSVDPKQHLYSMKLDYWKDLATSKNLKSNPEVQVHIAENIAKYEAKLQSTKPQATKAVANEAYVKANDHILNYKPSKNYDIDQTEKFTRWTNAKSKEKFKVDTSERYNKLHPIEQEATMVNSIRAKVSGTDIDKGIIDTYNFLEKKHKLNGNTSKFDPSNIDPQLKSQYPTHTNDLTEYASRKADLKAFEDGKISQQELRYREAQRLDSKVGQIGDQAGIDKLNQEFKDIGLDDYIDSAARTFKDNPKEVKLEAPQHYNKVRGYKLKAAQDYFKTGAKNYNTKGVPYLTQTEFDAISTAKQYGLYSYTDVINKTFPPTKDIMAKAKELNLSFAQAQRIVSKDNIQAFKDKLVNRTMSEFGIPAKSSYISPEVEMINHSRIDAKNSFAQNAAVLTGDNSLASLVFLKHTDDASNELRSKIGTNIQTKIGDKFGIKLTKSEIKPIFLVKTYGSMDKGAAVTAYNAIVDSNGKRLLNMEQATELVKLYNEAITELAPGIASIQQHIKKLMEHITDPVAKYEFNGHKASIDLRKPIEINVTSKNKKDTKIFIDSDTIDYYNRSLAPAIFQSIDAYVAKQMRQRLGIHSKHDAFFVPKDMDSNIVEVTYREILKELSDSNVLDQISRQLTNGKVGYTKSSKLDDKYLSMDRELLDYEHKVGDKITLDKEAVNKGVGKELSPTEVMTRYLTTESPFDINSNNVASKMTTIHQLTGELPKDVSTISQVYRNAYYGVASHTGIKVPEQSIDSNLFYKTVRQLHKQFRANIEFSTSGKLDGKRNFFDESGRPIGTHTTPIKEVRAHIEANAQKAVNGSIPKASPDIKAEINIRKSLREAAKVQKKVDDGKPITDAEMVQAGMIKNEAEYIPNKGDYSFKAVWKHVSDKFNQTKAYKQYTQLLSTKGQLNRAEAVGDTIQRRVDELLTGEDAKLFTTHLAHTNYSFVSNFKSRKQADAYIKQQWSALDIANKPELLEAIQKLGRGIGQDEYKLGIAVNNGADICRAYGIPLSKARDIEKMATLHKMKLNNSWDFIEKKWLDMPKQFEEILSMQKTLAENGSKHFEYGLNDPNYIYGHNLEHYTENRVYKDGKYVVDVEQQYQRGLLDIDRLESKLGTRVKEDVPNFKSTKELEDYLVSKRLRLKDGKLYSIADAKHRERLGRSQNMAEIMGSSYAALHKKDAQLFQTRKILESSDEYNLLFSKVEKEGFRKLHSEELAQLPTSLRETVSHVNADYFDKLVGRMKHSITNEDSSYLAKSVERLWDDFNSMFKTNVVIKNPSSVKNSLLSSLVIPLTYGLNPKELYRHSKNTSKEFVAYHQLIKQLDIASATNDVGKIKRLQAKIADLDIHKYIEEGLLVNSLDGARVTSTVLNQFASDLVNNKKINNLTNVLALNQGTKGGEFVKQLFSGTDAIGRVNMVKALLKKNAKNKSYTMKDAVREANDTFGNMDDMAPALISAIDSKGIVPFLGWASNTIPYAARLAKDNPKMTLAATLAVLYASDVLDVNLDSINPTDSYISFLESAVTDNLPMKVLSGNVSLTPYVVPNFMKQLFQQGNYQMNGEAWQTRPAMFFKHRLQSYTTGDGSIIDHRTGMQVAYDSVAK